MGKVQKANSRLVLINKGTKKAVASPLFIDRLSQVLILVLEKAQKYAKSKTSEQPASHCVLSCARPPAIDKPPLCVCSVSVSASVRNAQITWRAELRTFPLLLHKPKTLFSISPKQRAPLNKRYALKKADSMH